VSRSAGIVLASAFGVFSTIGLLSYVRHQEHVVRSDQLRRT
jgi:hypothetical protein